MRMDAQVLFSEDQAITATASSTNVYDADTERYLGTGNQLYLVSVVTTAMADSSSNSTVTVSLETDSTTLFGAGGSAATILTLPVFPAISAVGTRRQAAIPPGIATERYQKVKYTVANGDLSGGKFTTFITDSPEDVPVFAGGSTFTKSTGVA